MNNIENIDIVIKNGNIAEEKADLIVVPEFNSSASGGGVGWAIINAGMQAGLDLYNKAAQKKPFNCGDVMITKSGKRGVALAHVATVSASAQEQPVAVVKAVFNTLKFANDKNLQNIAVPELGTGIIGNLTQEQSAQLIFNAVYEFAKANPDSNVKKVSLVIYYGASLDPAIRVLANKTYMKLPDFMVGNKKIDGVRGLISLFYNNGIDISKSNGCR